MAKKKASNSIYIVTAPVKNFCGVGAAGVQFAYGKAEVREGWVLDWFKEHGYEVTLKDDLQSATGDAAGENSKE